MSAEESVPGAEITGGEPQVPGTVPVKPVATTALSLYLVTSSVAGFGFQFTSTPRPSGMTSSMKGARGTAVGVAAATRTGAACPGAGVEADTAEGKLPSAAATTTVTMADVAAIRRSPPMPPPLLAWTRGRYRLVR